MIYWKGTLGCGARQSNLVQVHLKCLNTETSSYQVIHIFFPAVDMKRLSYSFLFHDNPLDWSHEYVPAMCLVGKTTVQFCDRKLINLFRPIAWKNSAALCCNESGFQIFPIMRCDTLSSLSATAKTVTPSSLLQHISVLFKRTIHSVHMHHVLLYTAPPPWLINT